MVVYIYVFKSHINLHKFRLFKFVIPPFVICLISDELDMDMDINEIIGLHVH